MMAFVPAVDGEKAEILSAHQGGILITVNKIININHLQQQHVPCQLAAKICCDLVLVGNLMLSTSVSNE